MNILRSLSFIMVCILLYGCTSQTPEESDLPPKITQPEKLEKAGTFLDYENVEYGIKVGYPSDWQQTETEDIIVAFLPPKTGASDSVQENLGLTMNDLAGQGLTLPIYTEIVIEQLKQTFPDIKIIESGSTVLSNVPAHKTVFTASNLKFMQVWTIKNDLAYIWSYTATEDSYSDHLGNVQKMLDSFEITRDIRKDIEESNAYPKSSIADADPAFVGSWRVYSERIFYDIGGAGALGTPVSRNLELLKDGTWAFGDSEGTWIVTEITSEDWARWGINPYGPTRKITIDGWNEATVDGPVEEEKSQIDFIWIIYHIEPPLVENAGTIWLKFGH